MQLTLEASLASSKKAYYFEISNYLFPTISSSAISFSLFFWIIKYAIYFFLFSLRVQKDLQKLL